MFFSFLAVFPLPESYQNDPKFHFNTLLRSDTQKSSKNVENTTVFWSRCETVFGPPPAKADIATAILTNVIEHLVLLLPPNKHAFTAKAVWADLHILFAIMKCVVVMSSHSFQLHFLKFYLCCLIGSADCVRETAVARLNHVARWCSECITAKQRPADHPRTLAMPFVESLRLCEM